VHRFLTTLVALTIAGAAFGQQCAVLTPHNVFVLSANSNGSCVSPSGACLPGQTITFTVFAFPGTLDCCPHTFDWNFGDGTVVSGGGPQMTHVFATPGTYQVEVRITGCDTLQLDGTSQLVVRQSLPLPSSVPSLSRMASIALAVSLSFCGVSLVRR
jgi:PKD domain-containing protein